MGPFYRICCVAALFLCGTARAAVETYSASFNFDHTGSVSSGLVSVAATYTNTETAAAPTITLPKFNTTLGRLTQATVSVNTTTATFAVAPSGVLSLISAATADRKLTYAVTAGTSSGTDFNQVSNSGGALLTLLGLGGAEIGGAPLAKSSQFSASADLLQFTGPGSISVTLTAANTLTVTTLVSLLNGAGMTGTGKYIGSVNVTYTYTPWSLSGYVYRDTDHGGYKSGGENGTGLTLYAKLLNESSPGGPALQAVAVDPGTGLYAFAAAPGTYRIVIDDNATLSDVTPLVPPTGWTATQASTLLRSAVIVVRDVGNLDFGLIQATAACGRMFRDDGSGSGTANDGQRNGTEAALGGQVIRLLDVSDAVLDTASTAADGTYCVYIPSGVMVGAALRVVHVPNVALLATGAATGNSGGTYSRSTETISFAFASLSGYAGLNFGLVGLPTLTGNGAQAGTRSSVLWFGHRFQATSTGQVSFSISHSATANMGSLAEILYLDGNANGQVDAGEQPVAASIAVTAGSVLQLLLKVTIPVTAPYNARASIVLRADMSFTNAAPALIYSLTSTDTLEVMTAQAPTLQLTKAADKTSVLPGASIQYTIAFTNNGAKAITNLVINDATPAYTTFAATAAPSVPAALGTATVTTPTVGTRGSVQWTFPGQLMPGASGTVQFSVTVAP